MEDTTQIIMTTAFSLISLLVVVVGALLRGWMKRVEDAITDLTHLYQGAKVSEATRQGEILSLQKCIDQTSQNIGVLNNSVSKVWDVMLRSGLVEERPSDKVLGRSG